MEKPLFFENKNYKLFGVLHQPSESEPRQNTYGKTGIVFCAPFAEEKLITHRILVNIARRLTSEGFNCYRFDYMGHGDSEGDFEDSTVETRLSDISAAIDYLKLTTGISQVILFGIRFGATLALLASEFNQVVKNVVLVSPILNGKTYIGQVLRSNLTTQMATYKKIIKTRDVLIDELKEGQLVNIDGYLLSYELFKQIEAIDLNNLSTKNRPNLLMIQISKDQNLRVAPVVQKFHDHLKEDGWDVTLELIRNEPFWTDRNYYQSDIITIQDSFMNWMEKKQR